MMKPTDIARSICNLTELAMHLDCDGGIEKKHLSTAIIAAHQLSESLVVLLEAGDNHDQESES